MRFSILHITDLHRDLGDEVNNTCLLDSIEKDFEQFSQQVPGIMGPSLAIVSGDLVYGVKSTITDPAKELERQYAQAEEFLIGLADRFFGGNRERIIILPGNHDVCFTDVMESVQKIDIPDDPDKKSVLVRMLFAPNSQLRWSWDDLCFFQNYG